MSNIFSENLSAAFGDGKSKKLHFILNVQELVKMQWSYAIDT